MRVDDVFRLSLRPWRQKKVRVSLLMLAIAIGVASVIALVSQTAGAQQAVTRQLQALGPTLYCDNADRQNPVD
jgi:ABC-type antimicrobial peptide transport system permease subunit